MPESELLRYSTSLRSITHGRANFHKALHGYAELPEQVQQELSQAREAG